MLRVEASLKAARLEAAADFEQSVQHAAGLAAAIILSLACIYRPIRRNSRIAIPCCPRRGEIRLALGVEGVEEVAAPAGVGSARPLLMEPAAIRGVLGPPMVGFVAGHVVRTFDIGRRRGPHFLGFR